MHISDRDFVIALRALGALLSGLRRGPPLALALEDPDEILLVGLLASIAKVWLLELHILHLEYVGLLGGFLMTLQFIATEKVGETCVKTGDRFASFRRGLRQRCLHELGSQHRRLRAILHLRLFLPASANHEMKEGATWFRRLLQFIEPLLTFFTGGWRLEPAIPGLLNLHKRISNSRESAS